MATKTVTVEVDAYERLVQARQDPRESFSSVVRRAVWLDAPATCGSLLESLETLAANTPETLLDEASLEQLDRRSRIVREKSAWAANS